ncbi:MAG: histidine--tRNA ligase [Sphingobacteriia bacterium 24-36-13]|jgi:histidyl-tRNA synthetase|uniref:histidine--tRNA ligase n=1 Tax=Sediminibacterium sp. TaxID=1917865 RepID=UPI000BC53455|nr:histidine--tRNA ligase [Sediminibacterium sp.]OYY10928.1 MAG: histidine--tRNA ligase [Sphingobacteriia bacterium 35-36-14]OYZ54214.1 MAG: histidine--tRNA ligase [Sphingobacteriia bacterium 24-36-13]OZA65637.1 MAG: histidine--tRNA ligase [Sphingobacteriia bacterium 39-36-14]HQS23712.1 histidine--tRNA ligase [Sediminibacterium sp.]HQS34149.1 histidine--tRNA ligase [Sediminibacterium sp.]
MSNKAGIPQGTRDFNAATVQKRNYIFQTIRTVFELYGFQPLETPAMENLDTLMGKYGEEGDKLIFKILNNGLDNPAKQSQIIEDFNKILDGKNNKGITERALRYDLTIPFARYVAMNYGQLTMPFKRYQIQPVWRADRPQKGRYREFYQCDADVVGSNSLLNEVELTAIYATVFERLQLPVEIRINSRKILAGLAELCGGQELMVPITVAIDKLDKIGIEKVKEELLQRGINQDQILIIEKYLSIDGVNEAKIEQLKQLMGNNPTAIKGIEELEYILAYHSTKYSSKIVVDFTLARGLNYYTGVIFEIKAIGAQMGSIGGGGRYDDLTGLFGVPNVPGVGISFGVDRIYDVLEELKLFPEAVEKGTKVLFFNLGIQESKTAFYLMQELRESGIAAELYHEQSKFDKQFKYAEKKQVPYVVIIGSTELTEGTCIIKNIVNGEQKTISQQELVTQLF